MSFIYDLGMSAPLPDPNKEVSFDNLIEQYKDTAIQVCKERNIPEWNWRMLAEAWAQTDIEIIQIVRTIEPHKSAEQILRELL